MLLNHYYIPAITFFYVCHCWYQPGYPLSHNFFFIDPNIFQDQQHTLATVSKHVLLVLIVHPPTDCSALSRKLDGLLLHVLLFMNHLLVQTFHANSQTMILIYFQQTPFL